MKYSKLLGSLFIGVLLAAPHCEAALSLNFSSVPGAAIEFGGTASTFGFTTPVSGKYAGSHWQIKLPTGGVGDSLGDLGAINNGPWTYGPIIVNGQSQTATVTGNLGALVINDGLGGFVSGNVSWIEVGTFGTAGALNAKLTVNLSDLAYTPPALPATPESDLLTLVQDGAGSMILTFQFNPGKTLTELTSGSGGYRTTYSGSISPVPEPSTVLAGSLLLLPFAASTIRFARKNRRS